MDSCFIHSTDDGPARRPRHASITEVPSVASSSMFSGRLVQLQVDSWPSETGNGSGNLKRSSGSGSTQCRYSHANNGISTAYTVSSQPLRVGSSNWVAGMKGTAIQYRIQTGTHTQRPRLFIVHTTISHPWEDIHAAEWRTGEKAHPKSGCYLKCKCWGKFWIEGRWR